MQLKEAGAWQTRFFAKHKESKPPFTIIFMPPKASNGMDA